MLVANKLSLNKDKSYHSIFAPTAKLNSVPGYQRNPCRLGDLIIKRGIQLILDESLSFKEHFEDLTKQLNKLANSYRIVRYRVENDKC